MTGAMNFLKMLAIPGALLLTGCMDLDYVGQTFPPLPEDQAVALYTPEQPPPEGEYRSIGRATLTAPDGTEREEIQDKLIESAREHGADPVRIVEFKRIYVGDRYTAGGAEGGLPRNQDMGDRNPDGSYIYTDSFGQSSALSSPPKPIYEISVKALYLVTTARFEKVMQEYRKEMAAAEEAAVQPAGTLESTLEEIPPAEGTKISPDRPAKEPVKEPVTIELRKEPVVL